MDITSVTEALALATNAVGLTGKAATTAGTIKKLLSSEAAPDKDETAQLLNTLASELTAANMMNVQISDALRILSQEIKRQDEFEAEKDRYELIRTSEGAMVFKLKESKAYGQPMHHICPTCLNRDKIISFINGNDDYRFCQTDQKHQFQFSDTPFRHDGGSY